MKKLISLLICFALLISCTAVFASAEADAAISRVCGIGIMGDVADGDFRADDNITRAEFTAVALRMLGIFTSPQSTTVFGDVPETHWASGHIATASSMGLINGRGNGIFAPEDNVTYPEALKIIVCALGRDAAMSTYDYPASYIAQAGSLGITKGVTNTDSALTRAEVAILVDNALDVRPMEPIYGSQQGYEISEETLYEKLASIKDTQVYSGILMESANASLEYNPGYEEGYIKVDVMTFKTDKSYDDYIGQRVDVYYTIKGSTRTVVSLAPEVGANNVYTLPALDTLYEAGKITYEDASGKEKYYKLDSEVIVLVNGDRITPPQKYEMNLGEYVLIDNDGNNSIDVVSITKAESFVVEKISPETNAIYFDNDRTYHGRNGIVIDYDDDEREFVLSDKDGNSVAFEDIKAGDAVSVISNSDDSYVNLIIHSESLEGEIEGIEDEKITVAGQTHPVGKGDNGKLLFTPYIGMESVFVVDAFGYVVGTYGAIPDKFSYGYIAYAATTKGLDNRLKVRIVTGTEPKKDVKISNGDETISYHLQNEELKEYTFADSVKFGDNPIDARGKKLDSDSITSDMIVGKLAGYTLNSEGKINALNVYTMPTSFSSYDFNAEIFSFGGIRVNRGFIKDEETQIVCVPNSVRSADDYGVKVTITDENAYKVYGITGINENEYGTEAANAEPADIIVVRADMDSSLPPVIPADSDICIVGKATTQLDESGDDVCVIELLNGSEKEIYNVPSDSLAYAQSLKLRKGDLIQFTTNSHNEIASILKIASVQGLTDYTEDVNMYGVIEDIRYNVFDYFSNQMVDRIDVNVGNRIASVKLFKSDGQNIYLYDRKSGYIYPATSDDIKAASYYGNDASKLFAVIKDNDAQVIVIIKD